MSNKDKISTIAYYPIAKIIMITWWVIFAIVGAILFLNCIFEGPFIPLKYTFDNRWELICQGILHWGCVDFIFPIISIWKLYKLTQH